MPEISEAELATLKAAAKNAEKYQALYEALLPKHNEATEKLKQLPDLEAQVSQFKARELDQTYASHGVTDPKVRKIFDMEYNDLTAEAGKEKPALGEWLSSLRTQSDLPPHLKPFLAPAGAPAPAAVPARTPAGLPDANKGAKDVQAPPATFSAEAIHNMSLDQFKAAIPAIAASHPALAGIGNVLPPNK